MTYFTNFLSILFTTLCLKKMRFISLAILMFFASSRSWGSFLIEGDILYQDLDCGPLCEAIEAVTEGLAGAELSHMGVLIQDAQGRLVVAEAFGAVVQTVPLQTFLNRSKDASGRPKVIQARLKSPHYPAIPQAIHFIRRHIQKTPYDPYFSWGTDKLYCSELIYFAFRFAQQKLQRSIDEIFIAEPMTFKTKSGLFFEAWTQHFTKLRVKIPEGELGINPAGMSRSKAFCIVGSYGDPEGFDRSSGEINECKPDLSGHKEK